MFEAEASSTMFCMSCAISQSGKRGKLNLPVSKMGLVQAGSGPLKWKIPANLKYNFSKEYLEEVVDGKKTRMEVKIAVQSVWMYVA